jgi:hypothetical protein
MLFVLAVPISLAVAAAHRYLTLYAPSNILIRHVRMSPPRWRTVGALAVLTSLLILAMRAVDVAITAGAPGWLNLVALTLAWDAIKVGTTALDVIARSAIHRVPRGSASVLGQTGRVVETSTKV